MSACKEWLGLWIGVAICGGCSLVWVPKEPDAGADAGLDAFSVDAPRPDAFMLPPENCNTVGDEDRDGFSDCADPDCFGQRECCNVNPSVVPSPSYDRFTSEDWMGSGWQRNHMRVEFGSGIPKVMRLIPVGETGRMWRERCVTLANGAELSFYITRNAVGQLGDGESLSIVFGPAPAPGPSGFPSELSVVLEDHENFEPTISVLRLNRKVRMREEINQQCFPNASNNAPDRDRVLGGVSNLITIRFTPGTFGIRPVVFATVELYTSRSTQCPEQLVLTNPIPIPLDDLVSGPGLNHCNDIPGLFVGIEVKEPTENNPSFALLPLETGRDSSPSIKVQLFECASPAAFRRLGSLTRQTIEDRRPESAGGIGAPDLIYHEGKWYLAYDASNIDRSEKGFRSLQWTLGIATTDRSPTDSLWLSSFRARGLTFPSPKSRKEPTLRISDGIRLNWIEEQKIAWGSYEERMHTSILHQDSSLPEFEQNRCDSLGEPVFFRGWRQRSDRTWEREGDFFLVRCNRGSESHLSLWKRESPGAPSFRMESQDIVSTQSPIYGRVLAADVISSEQIHPSHSP
ncbi:MAG: hypothetical protein NZM37_09420, partial [Sandaracinaceae bacterium]|nr:hypothetical protein [Sandaracinaceae bacterium]